MIFVRIAVPVSRMVTVVLPSGPLTSLGYFVSREPGTSTRSAERANDASVRLSRATADRRLNVIFTTPSTGKVRAGPRASRTTGATHARRGADFQDGSVS